MSPDHGTNLPVPAARSVSAFPTAQTLDLLGRCKDRNSMGYQECQSVKSRRSKPYRLPRGITSATEIAKMFCWKTRSCAACALLGFAGVSWSTARAGEGDQATAR